MEKTFNEKRAELLEIIGSLPEEIKVRALALAEDVLKKAKKGSGIKKDSTQQKFRQALLEAENGELNEEQIFKLFGYGFGRHEALTACRNLHIRVGEGEDIIWAQDIVKEDGSTIYKILGIGKERPETYVERRKRKVVEEKPEEPVEVDEDFEASIAEGIDIH